MGQLAGLFYKNVKIQSKNKCSVCCQILTPLLCLLIIFGLQRLIDSLNLDDGPQFDSSDLLFSKKHMKPFQSLFRGFEPNVGPQIVDNVQKFMHKLEQAEVRVKSKRPINPKECQSLGCTSDNRNQFQVVETEKIVDDMKIPFNLLIPINVPLTDTQITEIFQGRFQLETCYKMLKFGVGNHNQEAEDYLRNTLKIDDDGSNHPRRVDCKVKDDPISPVIRVPNLEFSSDFDSTKSINDHLLQDEYQKLKKFDIHTILNHRVPTDGFMVFDEASSSRIKGSLSANNMQLSLYHHMNFMNSVKTKFGFTIFMNTETYFTMIDILSNSILASETQSPPNQQNVDQDVASALETILSKLTFEEVMEKWEDPVHEGSVEQAPNDPDPTYLGRQIFSFTLTYPQNNFNKNMLSSLFLLVTFFFYPYAIGMTLPIILYALLLEKEEKIRKLLKINGMSMFRYYFSNFLFWFIFLTVTAVIFFVGGFILLKDPFFRVNSPWYFIFFVIGWNVSTIMLAFFLTTMLSRAGSASTLGYIISLIGTIVGIIFTYFIYPFPARLPLVFNLIPHFNMVRIFYFMILNSSTEVTSNERNEFWWSMGCLYFNIFLYSFLTFLLSSRQYWKTLFSKFKEEKQEKTESDPGPRYSSPKTVKELEQLLQSDDQPFSLNYQNSEEIFRMLESDAMIDLSWFTEMHYSAVREKREIHKLLDSVSDTTTRVSELDLFAVITRSLSKTYSNQKKALLNLNWRVNKGEIYGLLGPNGAGKTTLISIVAGFLEKTSGTVIVAGKDTSLNPIPQKMSLCPQFNIQWPNLTVYEHLKIFAMMRGLSGKKLAEDLENIIERVDLEEKKDTEAQKLSGGMRRRLSIAMALIGETKIIFLDEPTSGLDPKQRRKLWNIIKSIRENKTFIISTHLMEEAEFLCDRIGIINKGKLRAVGTVNFLKKEIVNYLQVEILLKAKEPEQIQDASRRIQNELKGEISYSFGRLIKIQIKGNRFNGYLELFNSLDDSDDLIESFSLKSGGLEDVFTVIDEKYSNDN